MSDKVRVVERVYHEVQAVALGASKEATFFGTSSTELPAGKLPSGKQGNLIAMGFKINLEGVDTVAGSVDAVQMIEEGYFRSVIGNREGPRGPISAYPGGGPELMGSTGNATETWAVRNGFGLRPMVAPEWIGTNEIVTITLTGPYTALVAELKVECILQIAVQEPI